MGLMTSTMHKAPQWIGALCGLMLVATGCASPIEPVTVPDEQAPQAPDGSAPPAAQTPGTGQAPAPRKQPAPGNPARIFAPEQKGQPYYEVEGDIKRQITDECGGSLCVRIVLKAASSTEDERDCIYLRADPEQTKPGGTFVLYLSNLRCDPPTESSPEPGESSAPDATPTTEAPE
jgi:hypothetical protein